MSGDQSSPTAAPRFWDGVWVGKFSDIGYVVFDQTINNLYDEDGGIALWVAKDSRWQYFEENESRPKLRENLGQFSEGDRWRVARTYWRWRCGGRGVSKDDYARLKQEEADAQVEDAFFTGHQDVSEQRDEDLEPEVYYLKAVRERTSPQPAITSGEKTRGLCGYHGTPL